MYIQKPWVNPPPLRYENRDGRQDHNTEESGIDIELDEVFEGCFGYNTTDPGAEVIHFQHAAVNLAAVVGAVRLVG